MKLGISEILVKAAAEKKIEDRAAVLQKYDSQPLRMVLKMAHDKDLKWLVPEGKPPYTPHQGHDAQGMLYSEARRMYLFLEPDVKPMPQAKREALFVGLLESIDPMDAELLCSVKDKVLPYEQISTRVINKAFPGLLDGQNK